MYIRWLKEMKCNGVRCVLRGNSDNKIKTITIGIEHVRHKKERQLQKDGGCEYQMQ